MSHKVNHKTPFHTISAPGDVSLYSCVWKCKLIYHKKMVKSMVYSFLLGFFLMSLFKMGMFLKRKLNISNTGKTNQCRNINSVERMLSEGRHHCKNTSKKDNSLLKNMTTTMDSYRHVNIETAYQREIFN